MEASAAWYGRVFGFEVEGRTEFAAVGARVAFLARPGLRLELLQVDATYRPDGVFSELPTHLRALGYKAIVFEVADLDEATRELDALDVRIVWRLQRLGDGGPRSTLLRDADGNLINIFERGPPLQVLLARERAAPSPAFGCDEGLARKFWTCDCGLPSLPRPPWCSKGMEGAAAPEATASPGAGRPSSSPPVPCRSKSARREAVARAERCVRLSMPLLIQAAQRRSAPRRDG